MVSLLQVSKPIRKATALFLAGLLSVVAFCTAAPRSLLPVPDCTCCNGNPASCPTPACCAPQQPAKAPSAPAPAPTRSKIAWQVPFASGLVLFTVAGPASDDLTISSDSFSDTRT